MKKIKDTSRKKKKKMRMRISKKKMDSST